MIPALLVTLACAAQVTVAPPEPTDPAARVQDARAAEASFFSEAQRFESRHYLLLDQGQSARAQELSRLLEAAYVQFAEELGAKPRSGASQRLRVEVLQTRGQWLDRLQSIGASKEDSRFPGYYDARTRAVFALAQPTEHDTRAYLLHACLRQFHHACKTKNDSLVGAWFVLGMAERVGVHRWDGRQLELAPTLLLSQMDTPARALESFDRRPANLRRFTTELLGDQYMAWTFTSYLLDGGDTKSRERFQKLALGQRGSLLDGTQMASSLGDPDELVRTVEAWLRSVQSPFQILSGDLEEVRAGCVASRSASRGPCLALSRGPLERLSCVVTPAAGDVFGLLLDYSAPEDYVSATLLDGALLVRRVLGAKFEQLEGFDTPSIDSRPITLEVRRVRGHAQLYVNDVFLGSLPAEDERLGLIALSGSPTFTQLEWE